MLLYLFTANVLQYFQAVVKTGGEGGGASEEGEREGERCDLSMPLLSVTVGTTCARTVVGAAAGVWIFAKYKKNGNLKKKVE